MPRPLARTLVFAMFAAALPLPVTAAERTHDAAPRTLGTPGAELARLMDGSDDPLADAQRVMDAARAAWPGGRTTLDHIGEEVFVDISNPGDLDGDGAEDALEERYSYNYDTDEETNSITAVRASDGQQLWTVDRLSEGSFLWPGPRVGDLDGDAKADVLLYEFDSEWAEAYSSEAYVFDVTYGGTLRAVRGTDGTPLWARPMASQYSDFSRSWETDGAATFDLSYPLGAPQDVSGDAIPDQLVLHYAAAYLWDGATDQYQEVDGHLVFEVMSGRTGTPIATIPGGGYADASIVPDMNGDEMDDVAVVSLDPQGASIRAHTGVGGAPLWAVALTDPFLFASIQGADVNGDGRGDAIVTATSWTDEFDLVSTIDAYSGSDGAHLWTRAVPFDTIVVPAGDAVGDGGTDLLLLPDPWAWWDFVELLNHGGGGTRLLRMVRGSDGTDHWRRSISMFREAVPAGDLTGDGVTDILVEYRKKLAKRSSPAEQAISGATGGTRWARVEKRVDIFPLYADVNGDGADDVVRIVADRRYAPLSGRSGRSMWKQALGGTYVWDVVAAARSGGSDLLQAGEGSKWWLGLTALRSGENGSFRWKRTHGGVAQL